MSVIMFAARVNPTLYKNGYNTMITATYNSNINSFKNQIMKILESQILSESIDLFTTNSIDCFVKKTTEVDMKLISKGIVLNQQLWESESNKDELLHSTLNIMIEEKITCTPEESSIFLKTADDDIKKSEHSIRQISKNIELDKGNIKHLNDMLEMAKKTLATNTLNLQKETLKKNWIFKKLDKCLAALEQDNTAASSGGSGASSFGGGVRKKSKSKRNSKKRSKKSKK